MDAVTAGGEQGRRAWGWTAGLCFALVFALSFCMYLREMGIDSDMRIHAGLASEFSFLDPHSITCRIAYPVWHILVRALQYLGVSLRVSAALVTALFKLAGTAVAYRLYVAALGVEARGRAAVAAAVTMLVTGVRIASVNPFVYVGVSSPNVWHNPTQITVSFTMLLCVPYTAHCWYAFRQALPGMGGRAVLPWRKVACLAALLLLSTLCKPTFMQTLLPAAFVFFLAQWIRHPANSRYFGQIILAFLPAALCFLVQYLYYTGVLVPFTSGVSVGVTLEGALFMLRAVVMMAAFPLASLLCCERGEAKRDAALTLTLLIALFALLEAILFRETGMRQNDGNFTWGCSSAALMLWVVMTPKYLAAMRGWRALSPRRRIGCTLATGLLVWHIASSAYYVYYLLTKGLAY